MAEGKVHQKWHSRFMIPVLLISILLGWIVFAFTKNYLWGSIASLFVNFGFLFGKICENDLDLVSISGSEGMAMRKFGILGMIWVMFWFPYGFVMSNTLGHRNLFSHFPGISTVIRMIYLLWFPVILYCQYFVVDIYLILPLLSSFIGLTISDTIHYFLDIVS